MTMLAFHSDQEIKDKYLSRVQMHMEADELVRGVGYQPGQYGAKGQMCAVGCTLEAYDHSLYPIELGIPEWLARVEDILFEGMNEAKAITWPRDFLAAITPGIDLEKARAPFMIMVMESALTTFDQEKFPEVKAAIEGAIALWQRNDIASAAWSAAWSAARSAAWSAAESAAESAARSAAESAAWSAAWSAAMSAAWSAAWSAAESAAESAARSAAESAAESAARSAARSAAESAKYDQFADGLIDILRGLSA